MKIKLLITTLCIVFSGCNSGEKTIKVNNLNNSSYLMCVGIYAVGSYEDSYLITVDKNKNIEVVYGERKDNIFENLINMKVKKKEKKVLTEIEFNKLMTIKNNIEKIETVKKGNIKKDGWEIGIITNNKRYNFYYGEYSNTSLEILLKILINYSPIKIDIHSWS